MNTARRLYLYVLSGISLGVLVAGISMLLAAVFAALGMDSGSAVCCEVDQTRERLTLASALTVVSLPIWLIHWLAIERSLRPERPAAAAERTAGERGLYFALAMGILLFVTATSLSAVMRDVVANLAHAETFSGGTAQPLGLAIIAGGAWLGHIRIRNRDWARGPMTGGSAWLPRAYLYLAALVGLVNLLLGLGALLEVGGRLVLGQPPEFTAPGDRTWWAYPLSEAVNGIVIGGAVWVGHVAYARRLIQDPGWRGESERPARLRAAYFVGAILAGAGGAAYFLGLGLGQALQAALGVAQGDTAATVAGSIVIPIVSAIPFAIAWWGHARAIEAEAAASGQSVRSDAADRLVVYPTALVGLAFGSVALAWLIGVTIDVAFGGDRVLIGGGLAREQFGRLAPHFVIGAVVWLWAWRRASSRWVADQNGEAGSTIRRASVLLALAVSVIAGIIAGGVILYRAFGSAFGIQQSTDALSELSLPIGALLVAGAVAAYHAVVLRRDQSVRVDAVEQEPEAVAPSVPVALSLAGPDGADLGAMVDTLRAQLPPGYSLEITP